MHTKKHVNNVYKNYRDIFETSKIHKCLRRCHKSLFFFETSSWVERFSLDHHKDGLIYKSPTCSDISLESSSDQSLVMLDKSPSCSKTCSILHVKEQNLELIPRTCLVQPSVVLTQSLHGLNAIYSFPPTKPLFYKKISIMCLNKLPLDKLIYRCGLFIDFSLLEFGNNQRDQRFGPSRFTHQKSLRRSDL